MIRIDSAQSTQASGCNRASKRDTRSFIQEFDQGKGYLNREDLSLLVKKLVPGASPQELLYFRVMVRSDVHMVNERTLAMLKFAESKQIRLLIRIVLCLDPCRLT